MHLLFRLFADLVVESIKISISNNFGLNKHSLCGTLQMGGITVSIEKAIKIAAASVEMEGFKIDEKSREWCQLFLQGKISMEQYILLTKNKIGVPV